ncbi:MAG TPA: aa3-type cytochrome c oxidase subunit IV [Sphingomonas sp.]|jgi:hypothetical protein
MALHNDDLPSHERTYSRMISLLKWGSLAVALVTALVVWLIS